MNKPWEGTVTVKVSAEFVYTVDEDWEARDETHARQMVDSEMVGYLGDAFTDNRFEETWTCTHVSAHSTQSEQTGETE